MEMGIDDWILALVIAFLIFIGVVYILPILIGIVLAVVGIGLVVTAMKALL